MSKRKPIKAFSKGKHRVYTDNGFINSTVYIDTLGEFIMIKGARVKVVNTMGMYVCTM